MRRKRVGILISGRGSNMEALIRAAQNADYPAEIAVVISNRPEARGLAGARSLGIQASTVDHRQFSTRQSFEAELNRVLSSYNVDMIACAGFMRVLTSDFIAPWKGRIINIHPSLLPSYRGLDTHMRALADGVRIHGCTVHFVSSEVDSGPIIAQAAVGVLPNDTPGSLSERVLKAEHKLYANALELVALEKVRLESGRAVFQTAPVAPEPLFVPALSH